MIKLKNYIGEESLKQEIAKFCEKQTAEKVELEKSFSQKFGLAEAALKGKRLILRIRKKCDIISNLDLLVDKLIGNEQKRKNNKKIMI